MNGIRVLRAFLPLLAVLTAQLSNYAPYALRDVLPGAIPVGPEPDRLAVFRQGL